MTTLVLVSLAAMALAKGRLGRPPAQPPVGTAPPPLGTAGMEFGHDVRWASVLPLLDEHATGATPSAAATASMALAFLLTMILRLLKWRCSIRLYLRL
jgi:hypothetical protein